MSQFVTSGEYDIYTRLENPHIQWCHLDRCFTKAVTWLSIHRIILLPHHSSKSSGCVVTIVVGFTSVLSVESDETWFQAHLGYTCLRGNAPHNHWYRSHQHGYRRCQNLYSWGYRSPGTRARTFLEGILVDKGYILLTQ